MTDLEMINFAIGLYPCPRFLDKEIKIRIDIAPAFSAYIYYVYHNCKDVKHVQLWIGRIIRIIDYRASDFLILLHSSL